MSQIPNLPPQNLRNYSGWSPSASKKSYTRFLKYVGLFYVFFLCPLSACASSILGHRNGGIFYLVTFVTIIVAVYPLVSQAIKTEGGSVPLPPPDGVKNPVSEEEKPRYREVIFGRAKVINAFLIRSDLVGAGCEVTSGKLTRSARIRVWRRNRKVFEGNIDSLEQHYKGNVPEVASGDGCSVVVRGFSRFEVGDTIEAFVKVPVGKKPKGGSGAKGGENQKPKGGSGAKGGENQKPLRAVAIPSRITVKHLAELLHLSPNEIIKALTKYEIFADANQVIDYQRAALVAKDLGYKPSLRKG